MPRFKADQLRKLCSEIFETLGTPKENADFLSDLLVEANLTGHDSHGVIRVPIYAYRIKMGAVKPDAEIKLVKETPNTAVIDGGWNLGQIVARKAMNVCIEKAEESIVGLVLARNCMHVGRLNVYAEMAMRRGMIGMMSVNSTPTVTPFGGKSRQFGTNPLCFAIPAGNEKPMVLDMATSVWARGKIQVYLARGDELPEGVFLDSEGNPTTDPSWYHNGGLLRTLGDIVGYKGMGLSLLVEVLTGALTAAGCSNSSEYQSRPYYGGNGVFMMAIDIGQVTDIQEFKDRVDDLFYKVRTSPLAPGFNEVMIPGEPERREKAKRLREGIFVEEETWSKIKEVARELGVVIPL